MKRRRGTIEQWALKAGLPAAKARKAAVYEFDSAGGPGTFLTFEDVRRQAEILDLASLRWLLNLLKDAPSEKDAAMTAQIVTFVEPYLDNSSTESRPRSESEALQFVRQFVAELRHLVEKRGTGVKWKIAIGEISKTLSWEDILSGGSFFQAADWRGAFLLRSTQLIDQYGSRIRQCAFADCGRLFVRDHAGKQKFCSLKCGATERQRQFRAKLSDWTDYRRRGRQLRGQARERKEKWQALKSGKEKPR
jgi:hypothetical protein